MPATPPDFSLRPAENQDLKADILKYLGEDWLQAPNSWFSGRKPEALLGTGEETRLRELLDSILVGDFT